MKKWYRQPYFDSGSWILENFDKLGLNSEETLLILLIDFCKRNRKAISYDLFSAKLNKSSAEIDALVAGLVSRHYLKLSTNAKGLVFDIEPIFEFDPDEYEIAENKDLYDQIDQVFGKPLSTTELQKMNDLIENYGEDKFIEAVRIAEAQRKLKMSYIEGILRNERESR